MWKKIHAQFIEQIQGTPRSKQSMSSRYRHMRKDLKAWQEALAKAEGIYRSAITSSNGVQSL
ncbi:hypothetical protein DVH24_021637 [Malus domestica]|uniref:Uncharacterized protein n=1 Tax=Malus domestica TaxID=3750 RepID=A0A498JXB4_MALDO|nr:hypothetical protein DVH24_021637 [Malus domestica]